MCHTDPTACGPDGVSRSRDAHRVGLDGTYASRCPNTDASSFSSASVRWYTVTSCVRTVRSVRRSLLSPIWSWMDASSRSAAASTSPYPRSSTPVHDVVDAFPLNASPTVWLNVAYTNDAAAGAGWRRSRAAQARVQAWRALGVRGRLGAGMVW